MHQLQLDEELSVVYHSLHLKEKKIRENSKSEGFMSKESQFCNHTFLNRLIIIDPEVKHLCVCVCVYVFIGIFN